MAGYDISASLSSAAHSSASNNSPFVITGGHGNTIAGGGSQATGGNEMLGWIVIGVLAVIGLGAAWYFFGRKGRR